MNPALESKNEHVVRPDSTWEALLDCAAKEVFQIMLQKEVKTLPKPEQAGSLGDTTAMVGLAGSLCGVLSLRCEGTTAERITARMLGSGGPVQPNEIPDAMAEVCNMIAGNFKAKITRLSDSCMLSVPTVIRGDDYEMITVPEGEQISIYLGYDASLVWVCLAVHP